MNEFIIRAVVPMQGKAEELILHILPRVLRVVIVVRLARPKSVKDCFCKSYRHLDPSVVDNISK